jgi:hypothetical protein
MFGKCAILAVGPTIADKRFNQHLQQRVDAGKHIWHELDATSLFKFCSYLQPPPRAPQAVICCRTFGGSWTPSRHTAALSLFHPIPVSVSLGVALFFD